MDVYVESFGEHIHEKGISTKRRGLSMEIRNLLQPHLEWRGLTPSAARKMITDNGLSCSTLMA